MDQHFTCRYRPQDLHSMYSGHVPINEETVYQDKIEKKRGMPYACGNWLTPKCHRTLLPLYMHEEHDDGEWSGLQLTSSMMTTWYWGSLGSAVSIRSRIPSVRKVTLVPRPAVESNLTLYATSSLCSWRVSKATLRKPTPPSLEELLCRCHRQLLNHLYTVS